MRIRFELLILQETVKSFTKKSQQKCQGFEETKKENAEECQNVRDSNERRGGTKQ